MKGLPINDVHGNPVGHVVEATRDVKGNVTARISVHTDFARKHLASQTLSVTEQPSEEKKSP